jgi:hypothetical protein
MSDGRFPYTCSCRVDGWELARIDAASRLQNVDRATYVRGAILRRVAEDLQAATRAEAAEGHAE